VKGKIAIDAYRIFSKFIEKELLLNEGFQPTYAGLDHVILDEQELSERVNEVLNFKSTVREYKPASTEEVKMTQIAYLKHSNKCLITNGTELKVFDRDQNNAASEDWSSFSNFPCEQTDIIAMSVPKPELDFILNHLDWKQLQPQRRSLITNFLQAFCQ